MRKKDYIESYSWRDGVVRYNIDEQNRKVTCTFIPDSKKQDFYTLIKLDSELPHGKAKFSGINTIPSKPSVGIACCAEEDEFNPVIGKRIAFLKMRRDYHSRVMQVYHDLLKDIRMKEDALKEIIDKERQSYQRLSDRIRKETGL